MSASQKCIHALERDTSGPYGDAQDYRTREGSTWGENRLSISELALQLCKPDYTVTRLCFLFLTMTVE